MPAPHAGKRQGVYPLRGEQGACYGCMFPATPHNHIVMRKLKSAFDLDCKIALYVPSTIEVDKETDNSHMVKHVMRKLSELFGGATSTDAFGAWIDCSGNTIYERINIVYSFCTSEKASEHFGEVIALCEHIKTTMQQEAVTLEYNGQIKFI